MNLKRKKGQSILEYITIISLLIGAILVLQKYVARAISGRFKGAGDSWGYGRLYDPDKTTECIYDFRFTNQWYSKSCYDENNCDCEAGYGLPGGFYSSCQTCVSSCVSASPECNG